MKKLAGQLAGLFLIRTDASSEHGFRLPRGAKGGAFSSTDTPVCVRHNGGKHQRRCNSRFAGPGNTSAPHEHASLLDFASKKCEHFNLQVNITHT